MPHKLFIPTAASTAVPGDLRGRIVGQGLVVGGRGDMESAHFHSIRYPRLSGFGRQERDYEVLNEPPASGRRAAEN